MLSEYHRRFVNQTNDEISQKIKAKEQELEKIFKHTAVPIWSRSPLEVCILGCADKRYISGHRNIFARLLDREVHLTTLDVSIEHLQGEHDVIKHDVSIPLPGGPYDITYSHVLLKFIHTDKHLKVIEKSVRALKENGLAIHIFDKSDYQNPDGTKLAGYNPVDIDKITAFLGMAKVVVKA